VTLVNPDIIARELKPDHHDETTIMLKAGRIAALKRRMLIHAGESFAMETTLTGNSERRVMADARAAGYKITLVYVGLANALTSFVRVRERVASGGHDIPAQIIMRRYAKSLVNLPAAIAFAERVFILDNTGARHRLLVTINRGQIRHQSQRLPAWTRVVILEAAKYR
jgi:predicted ABC-type ATPase